MVPRPEQPKSTRLNPASAGFHADVLRRLWRRIEHDVEAGLIAGAVTLILRHQRPVLEWAQGWRDPNARVPMSADSVFWIASMSKPVCCAAALRLVEQGRLDLDAPVASYLPRFAECSVDGGTLGNGPVRDGSAGDRIAGNGRVAACDADSRDRPAGDAPQTSGELMTVRDLMRHTAGLSYPGFGDTLIHRLYAERGAYRFDQSNAQMADVLAALPLLHAPGSTFEYGMSIDLLGHVMETCTGQPLDALVAEHITGPLGMSDTHFRLPQPTLARIAQALPHENLSMRPPAWPAPQWLSGGGGLWSTAADYARFAEMLRQNGQHQGQCILQPASVRAMLSPQLPPGIRFGSYIQALASVAPTPEMGQNFGLGLSLRTQAHGNPLPGSVGDFTWPGMSGCNFWCDPLRGLVVVQMLQAPSQRFAYRAMLREAVYAALA